MHLLEEGLYRAGMALAACPTAPCHETHVRDYLLKQLAGLPRLTTRLDEFGNLHAHYSHEAQGREPVRLVAHMDHPAFVVGKGGSRTIEFRGGVDEGYFAGAEIVFHHEKTPEPLGKGRIRKTEFSPETKRVILEEPAPKDATFAVWDLPRARCTKSLFISPACDDLAQAATVLALLRRLAQSRARAEVHALFTRGEEIGFAGTFAALEDKPLAPMATLSLETSQARGFARVGAGPILRVGDRLSVFDSKITHWLDTAFRDLTVTAPKITYQRLLMGGGTCEASVFVRAGFPTGALCVALNNYHNMGLGRVVRSESISLRDWQGLYDFLFFLTTQARSLAEADQVVAKRFSKLRDMALRELRTD